MNTATLLDRLANLSAQRTTRTDRLDAAVGELLGALEKHVDAGESVIVDTYTLTLVLRRSNVGSLTMWHLASAYGETDCYLDMPYGKEGYLHGDFSAPWTGPTRHDLLAFASRATRFVEAFISLQAQHVGALESAEKTVEAGLALQKA